MQNSNIDLYSLHEHGIPGDGQMTLSPGGVYERVYVHEEWLDDTRAQMGNGRGSGRGCHIDLPMRYNAGYDLVSVSRDGKRLAKNVEWQEMYRMTDHCVDASALYWSRCLRILTPVRAGTYQITIRDRIIPDHVRGIRSVHINQDGRIISRHVKFHEYPYGYYPNGFTWDALPDKYKIEIWRKTKKSPRRFVLYRTVEANILALHGGVLVNDTFCDYDGKANRIAYLAYLRPDGARSLLSAEMIEIRRRISERTEGRRILIR